MSGTRVRPATADDVAGIASVWRAAWHDGHRGHVPDALLDARDAAYFATQADTLRSSTLVVDAPEGGGLLGIVITKDDELQQIMVDVRARGTGIADLLLAAAEGRIAVDHASAWLAVVPGNATARRFYERRGWHDHGQETYHALTLNSGTVPVNVCRYVKNLDTLRP